MAAVVVVLLLHQAGTSAPEAGTAKAAPQQAKRTVVEVRSVLDGDTIRVRLRNGRTERVRVLAVDTPEVGRNGRASDCYAEQATALTHRLVDEAGQVVLVSDPTQPNRDHYDRLLRYVELDDRDLGRELVDAGAATAWIGDPPARRAGTYRRAQEVAERAGAGRWGQC